MRDAATQKSNGSGGGGGGGTTTNVLKADELVTGFAPFVADERPGDGKLKRRFHSARGSASFEFPTAVKGKVLQTVIQASESLGGAGIDMHVEPGERSAEDGLSAAFQVHDANLLKLREDWADLRRVYCRGHLRTHHTS